MGFKGVFIARICFHDVSDCFHWKCKSISNKVLNLFIQDFVFLEVQSFVKLNLLVPCRTRKKYSCPFAAGMKVDSRLFVVSHDAKLLFSGGHWDNSLQVINVGKARKINHIVRHIGTCTCMIMCNVKTLTLVYF